MLTVCVVRVSAQTEAEEEALKDEMAQEYKQMQQGEPPLQRKKSKGFKRFFGKCVHLFVGGF